MPKNERSDVPLSTLLRAPKDVAIRRVATDATPGYPGQGKADADAEKARIEPELADLQERLYAQGKSNPETAPRVLLILQGLDTSGKGGAIRHAVGMVDPQGIQLKAFKAPTEEERKHHYLWRIENALPAVGMIGVFDRSHYEDVLIVRVEGWAPPDEIEKRYEEINAFESKLAQEGYAVVKCLLHISADEQKERLLERLSNPEKYWKYNPGDVDTRMKWDAYMTAFDAVLQRSNPDHAPWFIVPSDKKWYRDWAIAELLRETLARLNPQWPAAEFDPEHEKGRVAAS